MDITKVREAWKDILDTDVDEGNRFKDFIQPFDKEIIETALTDYERLLKKETQTKEILAETDEHYFRWNDRTMPRMILNIKKIWSDKSENK